MGSTLLEEFVLYIFFNELLSVVDSNWDFGAARNEFNFLLAAELFNVNGESTVDDVF